MCIRLCCVELWVVLHVRLYCVALWVALCVRACCKLLQVVSRDRLRCTSSYVVWHCRLCCASCCCTVSRGCVVSHTVLLYIRLCRTSGTVCLHAPGTRVSLTA